MLGREIISGGFFMPINSTRTVREIAVEVPGATRLFEKLGIDYCCGGATPLANACDKAGLAIDDVVRSLEEAEQSVEARKQAMNWSGESLTDLIAHINNKHHVFTREELERITPLMAKVAGVYGERLPDLLLVQELFLQLRQELLGHMLKEEQVLFPYVEHMEAVASGKATARQPFFVTVQNPVRMMMFEHDNAGEVLRQIRRLTRDFTAPEDACVSFRTLYSALEELERDLHEHIHLENNILFPRAVEMEAVA
jgi:regulator of cell morphogenesis and NO signaling